MDNETRKKYARAFVKFLRARCVASQYRTAIIADNNLDSQSSTTDALLAITLLPHDFVSGAFLWGGTRQGTRFWVEVSSEWYDILKRAGYSHYEI